MSDRTRYLSLQTVTRQTARQKRLTVTGGILTVFFAFGSIGGLTGYTEELRKGVLVYLVFLIPSILILYRGYSIGRQIGTARRYESIFAADKDGIVTLQELTRQTGISEERIFSELEKLFREGYFTDCTLQQEESPCVLLSDARIGEAGVGFVTVTCKNCCGQTRIRAGYRGACQFCGSPIYGKQGTE